MVERIESCATEKGQVVIPVVLRRKYGIKKGTRIQFIEREGQIILNPITPELFQRKLGSLRGLLKGGPSLTKELEAERAQDRDREERKIERWSGPR